jgi:hypothetical protein
VEKVNQQVDAINILEPGAKEGVSPSIYINDMYEQYKNTGDVNLVLQSAADRIAEAMRDVPVVAEDLKMEKASANIVFQLINTEQNQTMLANLPNRSFQDLSIIYRWVIRTEEHGIQSTMISNALAEKLGFSENQLFSLAAENTRRIFPPVVKSMNDVMREMFEKDGMPMEMEELLLEEIPPEQQMYVISNEKGINGASSMLYEDELHTLANSEFVALLKQANTDSSKMAEVIGVSEAQLRFVTNTSSGMGLIKCGSVVIPFDNQISKDTDLYKLYNTNIHEKIAEQKAQETTSSRPL